VTCPVITASTPSDSLSAACHFPGSPVIDRRTPHPRRTGAEEGLSSSHDGRFDVPRSIHRGVLRHPLQDRRCLPWPSPNSHGLGSPFALRSQATSRRCKLHLMLRTAKLLHSASDPAFRPNPGVSLPGTLASPRTGLAPAGRRELVARLRHECSFAVMAPPTCWTHGIFVGRSALECEEIAPCGLCAPRSRFHNCYPTGGCRTTAPYRSRSSSTTWRSVLLKLSKAAAPFAEEAREASLDRSCRG
jgi:hypothetical protein